MHYQFPHTIENGQGEKLTFLELVPEATGDRLLVENTVAPGVGPIMHTHFLQEESLTVVSGKIGYQVLGQQPQYACAGESVTFERGVTHRFWNAGEDTLYCKGWIKPANTIVFYLSAIFSAQKKSGSGRPEMFDAAFLLTRYSSEYEMAGIPWFVRKVVIPTTYFIGKVLGKYKHFKDAPAPVMPLDR